MRYQLAGYADRHAIVVEWQRNIEDPETAKVLDTLTAEQRQAVDYHKVARPRPAFDLPKGWVSGWSGTSGCFVGISPEGHTHS